MQQFLIVVTVIVVGAVFMTTLKRLLLDGNEGYSTRQSIIYIAYIVYGAILGHSIDLLFTSAG